MLIPLRFWSQELSSTAGERLSEGPPFIHGQSNFVVILFFVGMRLSHLARFTAIASLRVALLNTISLDTSEPGMAV